MDSLEDVREGFRVMSFFKKLMILLLVVVLCSPVVSYFGWLFYRAAFLTWTENYHFAYVYNYWTGEATAMDHNGFVYCPFWRGVVHTIDLRPIQVSLSTIQRVLNAKLVHFDPYPKDKETGLPAWKLFIKWHGRADYEGPGNAAVGTQTTFSSLLMNYAYDGTGKVYPFLFIEKELKDGSVVAARESAASKPETPGAQQ